MSGRRDDLRWLIAAFIASRAVIVAGAVLLAEHFMPDVRLYVTWTILLSHGMFPVGDTYWQYPPGAGALFALARVAGPDPVTGFIVLALIADIALLALLVTAARRRGTGLTAAWTWTLGGLLIGPLLVTRFDVFPALFAAAAIVLAGRPGWAGAAAGIGGMLKLWPVLALGAVRRRGLPLAIGAAIASAAILLAGITWWAGGVAGFLSGQADRGLQLESVAALPYLLAGDPRTTLRFGSFEIGAPGAATAGLALTAVGLVAIAAIGALRLLGRLERVPGGDVALALVLVSVATSRVFSPQYDTWIVAVAAAALADPRSRMRGVTWWLLGMCALTLAVFPWAYGSLIDGAPYAVALQAVRIAILLGCTGVACWRIARPSADDAADAAEATAVPRSQDR